MMHQQKWPGMVRMADVEPEGDVVVELEAFFLYIFFSNVEVALSFTFKCGRLAWDHMWIGTLPGLLFC